MHTIETEAVEFKIYSKRVVAIS